MSIGFNMESGDDYTSLTFNFLHGEVTASKLRETVIDQVDRVIAGLKAMHPDAFVGETPVATGTRMRLDLDRHDVYNSNTCDYSYLYVPNLNRRLENFSALEINYRVGSRTFNCVIPRSHIESDSITISLTPAGRDLIPNSTSKWGQYFVELGA